MSPQLGDIYKWTGPGDDLDKPILLTEFIEVAKALYGESIVVYRGLQLLSGEYGEFIFNESNSIYWVKLA